MLFRSQKVAQQQLRPKNSINKPFFAIVLLFVYSYTLYLILKKHAKLSASGLLSPGYSCIIQQSFGLLCFYTIWDRKKDRGVILLKDIYRY